MHTAGQSIPSASASDLMPPIGAPKCMQYDEIAGVLRL